MIQLLESLKYLNEKKVIHRDIKSSNVYLTVDGNLKLGDFGIAKVLSCTSDVAKTVVGTPYYMSPEVCENKPYTSKSDIWSLGCLFYELATLRHPFIGNSFLALVMNILKSSPDPIEYYSEPVKTIISMMLTKDSKVRPSAAEILNMPYFSQEEKSEKAEIEYDISFSSEGQEILYDYKEETMAVSGINPLELINTDSFEPSENSLTEYNYSMTIPTFTPDIKVMQKSAENTSKSNTKVEKLAESDEEEYEYEDDFESVTIK